MQIECSLTGASLRNCDTFIGWNIIKHQKDTYEDHTKTAISYDKTLNKKKKKKKNWEFPGGPVVSTPLLPLLQAQVQFLVRMPW